MKHKIKLPLSAVLVIVIITVYIIMSFSRYSFLLHKTYEQNLQGQILTATEQCSDFVNVKLNKQISNLEIISQIIGKDRNSLDEGEIVNLLTKYNEQFEALNIGIAAPEGTCYFYNGHKKEIMKFPFFKKTLNGHNTISANAKEIYGDNGILIAVPIYSHKNSKDIIGITIRYINSDKINDFLDICNTLKGNTWVVEENGTIIFSSDLKDVNLNFFSISSLKCAEDAVIKNIKYDIQQNKSGSINFLLNKDKYYFYYKPIGFNGWYVINSASDKTAVEKFNKVYINSLYFILNLAAALIILATTALISQQINKKKLKTANEELRRTKVKFETFIKNLPGGAFRCSFNEKTEFKFISVGLLKMFGYNLEEFRAKFNNSFANIIYERDRKLTIDNLNKQIAKEKFGEVKYRIQTAAGEIRWLLNRAQLVQDEDNNGELYSVLVDITESRIAHKKANEAMRQLESLANSIPGGVAQYLYDGRNITLKYANNGFYKLCGFKKEECKNIKGDPLIINAHPEDAQVLIAEIRHQISKKKPVTAEYRLIRKDRKIIWISLSGTRTVNENNQVIYQCIYNDITSLKNIQQELEVERERYQIVENLSDDILFEYDIVTDNMEFSPLYTALTGKRAHISNFLRDILKNDSICKEDLHGFKKFLNEFKVGNSQFSIEFRLKTRTGEYVWHRIKAKIIFDIDGKAKKAVGKAYNINLQKKEMQRLTEKSQRDPLTNLYNKISTQTQIEDYLSNCTSDFKHAMIMIDIDNFKSVNDNFGHIVGDKVISLISYRLQKLFRKSDIVGRIGGDEFAVFLRNVYKTDLVTEKAKEICDIFRNTKLENYPECRISGSIGIALYPNDGRTYEELYRKADMALYKAKKSGKNGYSFYSDIINQNNK